MYLDFLNSILIVGVIFFLLIIMRKVRKIHLWSYTVESNIINKTENVLSQIEALLGLYADLELDKSLPKTRGWAGSPDFLWYITRLTQKEKPYVVLECSSGVSTVVLAKSLKLIGCGHVYSLDHDPVFSEKTRDELRRHGLSDWATVIDAPLVGHEINGKKWMWYSLDGLPKNLSVDLLVIDGPPTSVGYLARYPAGDLLFKFLKENATIVLDDANRVDEKKIREMWAKEFSISEVEVGPCEKGISVFKKINKLS